MSYSDSADDIAESLEEHDIEADRNEIEESLTTLIEEYSVPEAEAKRSVLRNKGGDEFAEETSMTSGGDQVLVNDIQSPDNWFTVEVEVVQLWDPNHDSIQQTGLVGDESGRIKFTSWTDSGNPMLEEGETYRMDSVVSDEYQGRLSIQLNSSTETEPIDADIDVEDPTSTFAGAMVSVQSGSGLIKRCSADDCTRTLDSGRCSEHGSVDGEHDLRIKAVLDDGTEIQEVLFDADATERLTDIDLEKAKEMAQEALDPTVVEDEIRNRIVGQYYEVTGNVAGRYILADEAEGIAGPTDEEIDSVVSRVEAES